MCFSDLSISRKNVEKTILYIVISFTEGTKSVNQLLVLVLEDGTYLGGLSQVYVSEKTEKDRMWLGRHLEAKDVLTIVFRFCEDFETPLFKLWCDFVVGCFCFFRVFSLNVGHNPLNVLTIKV